LLFKFNLCRYDVAFICMLHLANEHGLTITDRASLTDLDISNITA
jgi:hypothetical protein